MPSLHSPAGLDDGAVGIDLGLIEELGWLSPPDVQPRLVVGVGGVQRCARNRSAGRNRPRWWGRESFGAQGVEVRLVLTAVFDVFQAGALAEGIEGDVEDVVRLMVGQVDAKQV